MSREIIPGIFTNINSTTDYKDFYISYCWRTSDYGCVTTAIVIGQMKHFYILNGDHREHYSDNLEQCLEYFKQNDDLRNKYSDKLD